MLLKIELSDQEKKHWVTIILFAFITGTLSWLGMPDGGLDMRNDILPSLLNWREPWKEGTPLFPWFIAILFPLRFFSAQAATAIVNALSIILVALLLRKYKGNPLLTIPIVSFPMIGLGLFKNGQTDALVLAGLLLPPGFDLLFFWKPQVVAHIFWVRAQGYIKTYLIAGGVIFITSLFIWHGWVENILFFGQEYLIDGWWNKSLWPYSIPFGIGLIYWAIKKGDEAYGLMASPLLFPYVNAPSYLGFVIAVAVKWPKLFWVLYAGYWLYIAVALIFPEYSLCIF